LLSSYASLFGPISRITIYPGLSYGFLEFQSALSSELLIKDLDADNVKVLNQHGKERHIAVFNTLLHDDELKNKATVDFPQSVKAETQGIPGLYVYDEFITQGK